MAQLSGSSSSNRKIQKKKKQERKEENPVETLKLLFSNKVYR